MSDFKNSPKKKNLDLFIKIKINCRIFHEILKQTHNKTFIFSMDTEQRLKYIGSVCMTRFFYHLIHTPRSKERSA